MLVGTSGIVDVLLVLVRVAASHVLSVPPLLPATPHNYQLNKACIKKKKTIVSTLFCGIGSKLYKI